MKIVIPPLVVEEHDGFKDDALAREDFGKALLHMITQSEDEGLVVSLDAQWGEGKTTFVKMWQGLLANDKTPSIYIDAFSNDYTDDAFMTIASAITAFVKEKIPEESKEKAEEFKKTIKRIGIQLLPWSAKIAIKLVTAGAIGNAEIKELSNIKDDCAKGIPDLVEDLIEERLESHSKQTAMIQSFRDLLSEIPSKLKDYDAKKPLVIILDELDRCKPTFAVDAVEKIKHLFAVKNVVFVLVMNKAQLEQAVKGVYGHGVDAHTYLQKFINLEVRLPKRLGDLYQTDVSKYTRRLFQLHQFEAFGAERYLIEPTEFLANHCNLSLRQLEKVLTNLVLFYSSITKKEADVSFAELIVFLTVVKVIDPALFERCRTGHATAQEIRNRPEFSTLPSDGEKSERFTQLMSKVKPLFLPEQEFNALPKDEQERCYLEVDLSGRKKNVVQRFAQRLACLNH